jgi:AraC family transcriptional regulator, regulatory protein of adaptative response / methylated-DNA-[protein]-cysteine methyltransferase
MNPTTPEAEGAYHYRTIARAIAALDEAGGTPLSLAELAARLGMSPAHFQRVFTQWVGVSPKRYQQYLALNQARALLSERFTMLDTALSTGLSGPGRLHDLFLRWEAMTPGDFARGGAGQVLHWGWFDSPFGPLLAMGTGRGLCGMAFAAERGAQDTFEDLAQRWPNATLREDPGALAGWVRAALGGGGEVAVAAIGAPFQVQVWEALLRIPQGQVTTYSEIARAIGRPSAVRAVGTAVGRNPLGWLIPCHRVLAKSGGLGGYHWGLGVKRAMLAWESARHEAVRD